MGNFPAEPEVKPICAAVPPSTPEVVEQGKAVLDGGTTRTIGSVHALEKLMEINQQLSGHKICITSILRTAQPLALETLRETSVSPQPPSRSTQMDELGSFRSMHWIMVMDQFFSALLH